MPPDALPPTPEVAPVDEPEPVPLEPIPEPAVPDPDMPDEDEALPLLPGTVLLLVPLPLMPLVPELPELPLPRLPELVVLELLVPDGPAPLPLLPPSPELPDAELLRPVLLLALPELSGALLQPATRVVRNNAATHTFKFMLVFISVLWLIDKSL